MQQTINCNTCKSEIHGRIYTSKWGNDYCKEHMLSLYGSIEEWNRVQRNYIVTGSAFL